MGLGMAKTPDKDDVGISDALAAIRGEEKIPASAGLDDLIQARLVDGQGLGVPGVNSLLVQVHDGDLDV